MAMFNQVDSPPHLELWLGLGPCTKPLSQGGSQHTLTKKEKEKTGNATIENARHQPAQFFPTCDLLFIAFFFQTCFYLTSPDPSGPLTITITVAARWSLTT